MLLTVQVNHVPDISEAAPLEEFYSNSMQTKLSLRREKKKKNAR